jgi:hypothetical protein
MQVQVNTDNATNGPEPFVDEVAATIRHLLLRFSDRLSRVEIHLSDVDAQRGGVDKHCLIELRPDGMAPVVASDQVETLDAAVSGAVAKSIAVLDHALSKLASHRRR